MSGPDGRGATLAEVRSAVFSPASPSICEGVVHHRRTRPAVHEFSQPVSMVWIDPDRPGELFDRHPLWSARRPAPYRFRRRDYGPIGDATPLAVGVRRALAESLGGEPRGPVRMLTQPRTMGWLFNPITLYFAWDDAADDPVGVVAEVTNTPWKERHRYAVPLSGGSPSLAEFDKELHVSPFLGAPLRYRLAVGACAGRLDVSIDVLDAQQRSLPPVLQTSLQLELQPADRRALTGAMLRHPFPTHRVSARIHREALHLWRKGVPFVAHPRRGAKAPPALEEAR